MIIPFIDHSSCTLCGACNTVCPFGALSIKNERLELNEVACKGCGLCQPICPTAAIQLINAREDELYDEIVGITGGVTNV